MSTDEGFREIQLNGKQLVFLFMAATVVSVVIFLCGVLVGRNVRTDRSAPPEAAAAIAPDPGVAPPPQTAAPPADAPPAEPPAPADELTYFDRLEKNNTPVENLKPSSNTHTSHPAAVEKRPPAAPPASAQPAAAPTDSASGATGEPAGAGFAVQVAAYRDRREADTLVKRLVGKGYPAFVIAPPKGAPLAMYRVRVGKYKDKAEADAVFHRLENEEQFKPWLVR